MCLIIHRELNAAGRGGNIPNQVIQYNRNFNKDGFGLAWRDGAEVKSAKFAPNEFAEFEMLLKSIDGDATIEYVAHFRTATHGAPCKEYSHPFTYEDAEVGLVHVFHNGVINIPTTKGENDTKVFVDFVLNQLPSRWWDTWLYKWMVEESIGWSRLLVMTSEETHRFNEGSWYEIDGLHYSTWPVAEHLKPKGVSTYSWQTAVDSDDSLRYVDAMSWSKRYYDKDTMEDLLPEDVIDGDTVEPLQLTAGIADPDGLGWEHDGHLVTPISQVEDDGLDKYGQLICETCETIGEYYVIDGKIMCDLQHLPNTPEVSMALALVG